MSLVCLRQGIQTNLYVLQCESRNVFLLVLLLHLLNSQDEVMTRRYGWRAVLKAMKIEGTHKGSEVEIKILPVNALTKLKQAS